MADLAAGRWGAQSQRIRALALRIVLDAGIDAKDYRGEVDAIHAWVQRTIRYTRDPIGQERVQTPEHTAFRIRAGDCDDFAVLEAALLGALGHRTRFITVGFTPDRFSHVYAEVELRGAWLPLDAITDHPPGWEAQGAALRTTWPVNQPGGFAPEAAAQARGVLDGVGGNATGGLGAGTAGLGGLGSLGAWYNPLSWFRSDPPPTPPPSPYGPLPDPAWIYANHGDAGADALRTGSTQPGWDAATSAQRSGYLTALRQVWRQQGEAIARTTGVLDTTRRVAAGVATLGASELVRAWDEAVAKAQQYRRLRTQALARADALAATQPSGAAALRQAVADGDAKVLEAMGPLRPFLAADAGLGALPLIAYGLGAAAIVAVVVALGWAIGRVGDAVRASGDAIAASGRGVESAAPVLLAALGVLGMWLWIRHRRTQGIGGARTSSAGSKRPRSETGMTAGVRPRTRAGSSNPHRR